MVIILLPLLGCQSVVRLSKDLKERSRSVLLSGVVRAVSTPEDVLVVATTRPDAEDGEALTGSDAWSAREMVAFSRLTSSLAFALVVPENRHYWVAAFGDRNGNGRWDAEEEGGEIEINTGTGADHEIKVLEINLGKRPESYEKVTVPRDLRGTEAIRIRTGELSTLDDPHLSSEAGLRGLWQPLAYGREIGFGIDFLEPYDPGRTGVLFLNGAGGSPQDWRAAIEELDRARFQPWVLVYPSGSPLVEMVDGTVGVLEELGKVYDVDHVILVAHSMGGLIARAVTDQMTSSESRPTVDLLVTVSTPFLGHSAAGLGVRYSLAVVPSWRDLEPGSNYLAHLAKSRLRGRVPHIVFFSFGGPSWLMSYNNDGSVGIASQLPPWLQEDAELVRGFDRDHMEILADPDMLFQLEQVLREAH